LSINGFQNFERNEVKNYEVYLEIRQEVFDELQPKF